MGTERQEISEEAVELIADVVAESSREQSRWLKAAAFFGSMSVAGTTLLVATDNETAALVGVATAYTSFLGTNLSMTVFALSTPKNCEQPPR